MSPKVLFKILQLDGGGGAALVWAKKEAHRLASLPGAKAFTRFATIGDFDVSVKGEHYADGASGHYVARIRVVAKVALGWGRFNAQDPDNPNGSFPGVMLWSGKNKKRWDVPFPNNEWPFPVPRAGSTSGPSSQAITSFDSNSRLYVAFVNVAAHQVTVYVQIDPTHSAHFTFSYVQAAFATSLLLAASSYADALLITVYADQLGGEAHRFYCTFNSVIKHDGSVDLEAKVTEMPVGIISFNETTNRVLVDGGFTNIASTIFITTSGPGSTSFTPRAASVELATGNRSDFTFDPINQDDVIVQAEPDGLGHFQFQSTTDTHQTMDAWPTEDPRRPWSAVTKTRATLASFNIVTGNAAPFFFPVGSKTSFYRGADLVFEIGGIGDGFDYRVLASTSFITILNPGSPPALVPFGMSRAGGVNDYCANPRAAPILWFKIPLVPVPADFFAANTLGVGAGQGLQQHDLRSAQLFMTILDENGAHTFSLDPALIPIEASGGVHIPIVATSFDGTAIVLVNSVDIAKSLVFDKKIANSPPWTPRTIDATVSGSSVNFPVPDDQIVFVADDYWVVSRDSGKWRATSYKVIPIIEAHHSERLFSKPGMYFAGPGNLFPDEHPDTPR